MANQRQRNHVRRRKRYSLLQQILQLPHVARPWRADNRRERVGRKRRHRLAVTGGNLPQKMCCQQRNIFAPFSQRRQFQRDHVQAIKQVFSKRAIRAHLIEIAMRSRDDAHVHIHRLRRAHGPHRAVLQHTQQLRLKREWHVADFIEKQAAAIGRLKQSLLRGRSARKRTLGITEQLTLQQLLRDRRTVNRHERLGGSIARGVNRARQQLFSGARFTQH